MLLDSPGRLDMFWTSFFGAALDEAHAILVESEGCGVLRCVATTSFGSVEGAKALFSKIVDNDTGFPDDDPCGGRSYYFWRWCFVNGHTIVQTPSSK